MRVLARKSCKCIASNLLVLAILYKVKSFNLPKIEITQKHSEMLLNKRKISDTKKRHILTGHRLCGKSLPWLSWRSKRYPV